MIDFENARIKVGDIVVTTCRIDNMLGHIERGTPVEIIKTKNGSYDIQDVHGNEFFLVDGECLEKLPSKVEKG